MRILFIADLHVCSNTNVIKDIMQREKYDLTISLGDNTEYDLNNIMLYNTKSVPIYGVLGNHDLYHVFSHFPSITNLHCKKTEYKGLSFIGIEGCMKYKEVNVPMYTDDQVSRLVKTMLPSDVLVSHTGPSGLMDKDNDDISRRGFSAFNNYYKTAKPKYHFFGHYHKNEHHTVYHGWNLTECYCIFGISLFDTETNTMTKLFSEEE